MQCKPLTRELLAGMQPSGTSPVFGLGGTPFSSMGTYTVRKIKKLIKHETKVAIRCMCPEDNNITKLVFSTMLRCMIKGACGLSGQCGQTCTKCMPGHTECTGYCQCGCKCGSSCGCTCDPRGCQCRKGCNRSECTPTSECCQMECGIRNYVANVCKCFLEHKYKEAKEMLKIALDSFRELKGCIPPVCGQPGKDFIKAVCGLMHKMCTKGCCNPERQRCIANKYWINYVENIEHCVKYKAKRIAQKFMRYTRDKECDDLCKQVGVKCLSRGLIMSFLAQKLVLHNLKCEEQKKMEEKKDPETKEELCPEGLRYKWKQHNKFWRRCVRRQALCFVHDWLKNYLEPLKICTGLARDQVDTFFKENNIHDEYRRIKYISKIVARCMLGTYNEKKTKEAFGESVKKYARGLLINCDKKVLKNSRRKTKLAMKLNGVKDDDVLFIGARFGGISCCRQRGKEGFKEEKCMEFTNKWVKDFTPVVTEAVNAARELIKECKELCNNKFMSCFILRKTTLWYLQMNFTGAKFNREDFNTFWQNMLNKSRALQEQANKILHESCRIACEGSEIKCTGTELNLLMLSMLDMSLSGKKKPYQMMSHSKRFQRLKQIMYYYRTGCGMACNMCTGMYQGLGQGTTHGQGMMMSPGMMSMMMPNMMMPGMMMPGMMGQMPMMRPGMMQQMMPQMMMQMPGMMGMHGGMMMPQGEMESEKMRKEQQ